MPRLRSNNNLLYRWFGVLRCPQCHGDFLQEMRESSSALRCRDCSAGYGINDHIPRLIIPELLNEIASFCEKYDAVRLREGWASETPDYYLNLPFRDLSGRHAHEWQLRAQSFRFLQNWLKKNYGSRNLRILDIGAGSGWMSRLLADQHEVFALDVNAGPHGLAALPFGQRCFMAAQAELERFPLAGNSFDLVIANASLHYTHDLLQVFKQVSNVLRPGGKFLVMDSPVYPTGEAARVAHQRSRAYYAQHGVPELANNYGGLTEELFTQASALRFTRVRRDFSKLDYFKKWLRDKIGNGGAARFPIWMGERIPQSEEVWQPGRSRAGAVVIHESRLLTYRCQMRDQSFHRIPGGGIEPNETPEQTALRELHEELGLTVKLQHRFGPYFHASKAEWYFLSAVDTANLPLHETPAPEDNCLVHWLPLERLADYDIHPPALKWELVEYLNT